MSLRARIESRSVQGLVRLACGLALVGLGVLCFSVIVPRPIPVIFAMSVGHAIGIAAFVFYLLAVVLDAARREAVSTASASTSPANDSDESLRMNMKETEK